MFLPNRGLAAEGSFVDTVVGQLRLALPMFFVLSGYLIYRSFAGATIDGRPLPHLGVYALRRLARVGPAYWAAIVLGGGVLAALGSVYAQPVSVLPSFLLFVQIYDPATAGVLNPPTWTVAVEASFYVLVPLLAVAVLPVMSRLRTPGTRRLALAALCVALTAAGTALLGIASLSGWGIDVRHTLPARMGAFGAGMLVAVLAHRRSCGGRATAALAAGGVALVALEAAAHVFSLGPASLRLAVVDAPASAGFALLVAAVATGRPRGAVAFERGPLQWYGTISFGLYLAHFPVIYVLRTLEVFPDSPAAAIGAVLGISTVLALVSWHAVEKPSIAWAHQRSPTRASVRRSRMSSAPAD